MTVPGRGPLTAQILCLGESPGEREEISGQPFVGPSGRMLCEQILGNAGIREAEVRFDNVLQTRTRNPTNLQIADALVDLRHRLRALPNLQLIIAVGAVPTKALSIFQRPGWDEKGKESEFGKWAGSILKARLVNQWFVPIMHPAWILRGQYKFLHAQIAYVQKAKEVIFAPGGFSYPRRDHRILYRFDESLDSLAKLYDERVSKNLPFAFDIETSLPCLGFAPDKDHSFTIPYESHDHPLLRSQSEKEALNHALKKIFCKEAKVITQNGLFDMEVLWRDYSIESTDWQIFSDTMYKHQLLYPEFPHGLDFLTSIYTNEPYYKEEGRKWRRGVDPEKQFFTYNGKDCCVTYEADQGMEAEIEEAGQKEYFYDTLMPLLPVLFSMKRRGIPFDPQELEKIRKDLKRKILVDQCKLAHKVGMVPNVKSPIDKEHFLKAVGVKERDFKRSEKTGKILADEDFFQRMYAKYPHPALLDFMRIGESRTLLSGFTNFKLDSNNRYHPDWKLGPKSGRLACSGDEGPQMQNVPESSRTAVCAPPGRIFVGADLAQAEPRIVAYISEEPTLMEIFESSDQDVYAQVCSKLFNIPRDQIVKGVSFIIERDTAKETVLGGNYGMGPRKHVMSLRKRGIFINEARAKENQDAYFSRFPYIRIWQSNIKKQVISTRLLVDLLGRRHVFLGDLGDDKTFREAFDRIPQSTVAGIVAKAMIQLHNLFAQWPKPNPPAIILQIHDELICECNIEDAEEVQLQMQLALSIPLAAHGRKFIIPAEFKSGRRWGCLTKTPRSLIGSANI